MALYVCSAASWWELPWHANFQKFIPPLALFSNLAEVCKVIGNWFLYHIPNLVWEGADTQKTSENLGASPLREAFRLVPFSAESILLDSPFTINYGHHLPTVPVDRVLVLFKNNWRQGGKSTTTFPFNKLNKQNNNITDSSAHCHKTGTYTM